MLQTIVEHISNIQQKSTSDLTSALIWIVIVAVLTDATSYLHKKTWAKFKVFFWQFTSSLAKGNFRIRLGTWSKENIEFLIKHHEEERLRVKAIKNDDPKERLHLQKSFSATIRRVVLFFIVILIAYLTDYLNNYLVICGLIGMTANLLLAFSKSLYSLKLMKDAYFFDRYINSTESKINKLKMLLES